MCKVRQDETWRFTVNELLATASDSSFAGRVCPILLPWYVPQPLDLQRVSLSCDEETDRVGMLNAVQGIGAGGARAADTSLVARGNAALYSCFAVFGVFSGSVINTVGPKIPLMA